VGIFQQGQSNDGDGDVETVIGAVTEIGDAERQRARQASIVAQWSDERGVGPIPFPGTAYARACTTP
jgi:hypothetical protein